MSVRMMSDFLRVKQTPEKRTYPMRLELAGYYCEDTFDFLRRYQLAFYSNQVDFQNVKSRRAKSYVDLRMALEALLKALICLRAPRDLSGKPLVRMILRYSHDTARLKTDALKGIRLDARYGDAIDKCKIARLTLDISLMP
jgi:hypothetical protein